MIRVLDDPEALAAAAAAVIAEIVTVSVERDGRCILALAGGRTPVGTYRVLARRYGDELPWNRTHVVFGDERLVPPDHRDSNYGMAREALLRHVPIPADHVHRVPTERGSVEAAAEAYERELWSLFDCGGDETPRLDLVLLGLGSDGHTASLMPGCDAVGDRRRLVTWCRLDRLDHPRVTAGLRLINAARRAVFLVSGGAKADVLRAVLEGPVRPQRFPAQLVRPSGREPEWLVDAAAARELADPPTTAPG